VRGCFRVLDCLEQSATVVWWGHPCYQDHRRGTTTTEAVVTAIYEGAGASAIYVDCPLEGMHRDIRAVTHNTRFCGSCDWRTLDGST
jgi:hypothetical protein